MDLIRKLISGPKERLGINGVQEIKAHPFFVGIEWKKLSQKRPPFVPNVNQLSLLTSYDQK